MTRKDNARRARLIGSLIKRWHIFAIDPLGRPVAYRGGDAAKGEPYRVNQVFPTYMLDYFIKCEE